MQTMSHRKGFLQDARETLFQARPYRLWQSILGYVRKFRMISFLLRLTGWILTILQTGALVLLTTAIFFVILPLLTAVLAGLMLTALLDTRHSLRAIRPRLSGKQVYVFFGETGAFREAEARALANEENTAVLIVSPHWVISRGIGKRRFYVNVRQEGNQLFLIRRYFYFTLRKRVLKKENTVLVY